MLDVMASSDLYCSGSGSEAGELESLNLQLRSNELAQDKNIYQSNM